MWRTGELFGYRWESITNKEGKIIRTALHRAGKDLQPGKLMKMYIWIKSR